MKKLVIALVTIFIAMTSFPTLTTAETIVFSGTFVRGTGLPMAETYSFEGVNGPATIKLWNGAADSDAEKVSSSEVTVNGVVIFGPHNFNQKVGALEAEVMLEEGINSLNVLLKSKPGGQVTIQITQILPLVKISGHVLGGAPMVGTVNIKDSSDPANFSFSGIEIDGSYSLSIDPAWQPPFLLWAEGYVNGVHMTMLSYLDIDEYEFSKICNITPATTAIVSAAMGSTVEDIDPMEAEIPASTDVDALKEMVQAILVAFFAVFDMPEDFDLFESPIAVGEGADLMFDSVAFYANDDGNVVLASKIDPSVELAITDTTEADDAFELVEKAVEAKSAIEQFNYFFTTLYDLYKDERPILPTLQTEITPLCAPELVHSGSHSLSEMLAVMASDPFRSPSIGQELVSCSIYRPMQFQQYGPQTIHEMPDSVYSQGLWVLVTIKSNDKLLNFLSSFVYDGGGNWLFYGNRRPFVSGGRVAPRTQKYISPIGSKVYEHGLNFWNVDVGNNARLNTNMTNMAIFNLAMPAETIDGVDTNCLRMGPREGGLSTRYGIKNVSAQYDSVYYRHLGDGSANDLDLGTLAAQGSSEFIMIGLNDSDEPVYAWLNILGSLPPDLDDLIFNDGYYFGSLLTPEGWDEIIIPGVTQISWSLPDNEDLVPFWSKLEWVNIDSLWQEIYVYNPTHYGPADYYAFTSADHDASAYGEGVRRAYSVVTMLDPASNNSFRASQEHWPPWLADTIEAKEGEVFFDVQKGYSSETSNQIYAAIRATDRAINRIQTDLTVDSAVAEGENIDLRVEVRLLYQPDANWVAANDEKDLFIVSALIQLWKGDLIVNGFALGLENASGSIRYPIPSAEGNFPFGKKVALGETVTLAVEYDVVTNTLNIEFEGYISRYDMSDVAAFNPDNFKGAEIRSRVRGINVPGDFGRIQASCDNVWVDNLAYDNFDSGIGINKWWMRAGE